MPAPLNPSSLPSEHRCLCGKNVCFAVPAAGKDRELPKGIALLQWVFISATTRILRRIRFLGKGLTQIILKDICAQLSLLNS